LRHSFEVSPNDLREHLDEMVDFVFNDLQSQFLVMPQGKNFVKYQDFQRAYEVLKTETAAFADCTETAVWSSLRRDSLSFLVLRTILGVSPPEWGDLAKSELGTDVPQGVARSLDSRCRTNRQYFAGLSSGKPTLALERARALITVALKYIERGAPPGAIDTVHRLAKIDTTQGIDSLRHVSSHHVPYAVLLYERYLGSPFASHRNSVSEMVGDVMESAIEERLSRANITFRKTKRAERVPEWEQAPDFFIPDEINPAAVIEAKITGDDGTARDKVTRIEKLATIRDERLRRGLPPVELIACIDGRGFGVRREDMKRMLLRTEGKVFTLVTLDKIVTNTVLRNFLPRPPS
jgi:hypothetical protein